MRFRRRKDSKKEKSKPEEVSINEKIRFETTDNLTIGDYIASIMFNISEIAKKNNVNLKLVSVEMVNTIDNSSKTIIVSVPVDWNEQIIKQYISQIRDLIVDIIEPRLRRLYGNNTTTIGRYLLFLQGIEDDLKILLEKVERRKQLLTMEDSNINSNQENKNN